MLKPPLCNFPGQLLAKKRQFEFFFQSIDELFLSKFLDLCEKESYSVGYHDGRLKTGGRTRIESAMISTGLFECHDGCACHEKFCSNRVVQFGMKVSFFQYVVCRNFIFTNLSNLIDFKTEYFPVGKTRNNLKVF